VDNPAITKSADHSPKIATALNGAKIDTDGLNVVELAYTGKVNLRGDFESSAVNSQLTSLLGMESKVAPNTYTSNGANTLFWLGPDERLLYTDNNTASIIEQWRGHPATAAVDVSDYLIVLQLSGAKTRDVIASGAPFDSATRLSCCRIKPIHLCFNYRCAGASPSMYMNTLSEWKNTFKPPI